MQTEVNNIKDKFRILKKWKIFFSPATKDQRAIIAYSSNHKKTAIIYGFGQNEVPEDYYLHEVLHCAFKELLSMDKRKPKELSEVEELLVQDICNIIFSKEQDK
jgi:hypothetical protein